MSDDNLTYAWIRSSAAMLKLPLEPAWLPTIEANVEVTFRLARLDRRIPASGRDRARAGLRDLTMADWTFAKGHEIAGAVSRGEVSVQTVVESALAAIRTRDQVLNAFTDVTASARCRARKSLDAAHAAGKPLGPLAGVPFAVKNLFDVEGLPTRAGSKINRELPLRRSMTRR